MPGRDGAAMRGRGEDEAAQPRQQRVWWRREVGGENWGSEATDAISAALGTSSAPGWARPSRLARCNSNSFTHRPEFDQPHAATIQPTPAFFTKKKVPKRPGVGELLACEAERPNLHAPTAPVRRALFPQNPLNPDFPSHSHPPIHHLIPSTSTCSVSRPTLPQYHHEGHRHILCINYLCAHHVARSAAPDSPSQPATGAIGALPKSRDLGVWMVFSVPPWC